MHPQTLSQLNVAVGNYFTADELKYIEAMIYSYQSLIDKDPAYEVDDYVSELFLSLVEMQKGGSTDRARSKAVYYLKYVKTLMLVRARRTKIRKKVENMLFHLYDLGSCEEEHLKNLDSFVEYLLDEGEDELFYILLLTISSVLNDKDIKWDRLNISKISADLPVHYLKYRRYIEKIRRLYEQA